MNDPSDRTGEIAMDAANLYSEETFTDNRVGTIRRMSPVTSEGHADASRSVRYLGSAQIMTPAGALPISFEIEALNLSDAVAGFGDAARAAVERTMEELRELQRQQASSIVVPGAGGVGAPGGGGIQLP
jgi:tRNA A37 threonylcarbamoyladenosine dehydratase